MSRRTETEGDIINHKFEVANERCCRDVLIISAGHVAAFGNRVVLQCLEQGREHFRVHQKRKVHAKRVPRQPTQEQYEHHCMTHIHYRDWCRFCIAGGGSPASR